MHDVVERTLQRYPRPYLTDVEIEVLFDGTPDSRYGKVKRLLAQGKLLHIRRGLYCLTEVIGYPTKPHPFELAQYIYGPSYISLESALSYHQLIPEAAYTVTSVTAKRAKEFHTPLGVFSYQNLPLEDFYIEVELIKENGRSFFMAKPWKAICDYAYCNRKDGGSIYALLDSLRVDMDALPILRVEEIQSLDLFYHRSRMSRFLKQIRAFQHTGSTRR